MSQEPGPLVIIGGAEDKTGRCDVLREFVRLAGESEARILVMTVATELPLAVGAEYVEVFERLGVADARTFDVSKRQDADSPSALRAIEKATGVFFSGGDQVRITELLGGTRMDQALHAARQRGLVLAGTSAGASMMSNSMIVEGVAETNPRPGIVEMAPGMEFISGVIIDQHFAQRGRLARLLTAAARYPHHLGLGIDEDTAVVVKNEQLRVIGRGAVSVVDAANLTYSNVQRAPSSDNFALYGVALHVLPAGHCFDLRERRPLIPEFAPHEE